MAWASEWKKIRTKSHGDATCGDDAAPCPGTKRRSDTRDRRKNGTGKAGAKAKAKAKAAGGGGAAGVDKTTTTAKAPPSNATVPTATTVPDTNTMAHIPIEELDLARGVSGKFSIKGERKDSWYGYRLPPLQRRLVIPGPLPP